MRRSPSEREIRQTNAPRARPPVSQARTSVSRSPILVFAAGAALGAAAFGLLSRLVVGEPFESSAASVSEIRALSQQRPTDERLPIQLARRFLIEQRYPQAAREIKQA